MHTQQPKTNKSFSGKIILTGLYLLLLLFTYGPAAAASTYYSVCQDGAVVISASGSGGSWAAFPANPGTSALLHPGSDTTTVYGFAISGQYAYIWTSTGAIDTAYVTVTAPPVADAGPGINTCIGSTVQIGGAPTASGGSGHYQLSWSPLINISDPFSANPYVSPTADQTFLVTVTDTVSGCSSQDTVTVRVYTLPVANAGPDVHVCAGSTVAIGGTPTGSDGSGQYRYLWSPGVGLSSAAVADPIVMAMIHTAYIVTVTDQISGCTATDTVAVLVNQLPTVNVNTQNIACYGQNSGSVCATATGAAPLSYAWNSGGTLPCFSTALAATYIVTVTDANGCYGTASGTVSQPASVFSATVVHTDELCYGGTTGTITVTAQGGTYPYTTAAWSDGDTGVVRRGMAAGMYTYTIADANGCQQTGSVTITQPASAFTVTASHTDAGCTGATGTITLTESGGTTPYGTVDWPSGLSGTNPVNVPAGTYTYTVTDANSCQATGSVVVSGDGLSIADSAFNATCNGLADGRMVALAYGGVAPYSYVWSTGDTTAQITHLSVGSYQVTATDARGCSAILMDNIGQSTSVSLVVVSVTDASCYGQNDGSACVAASGGVPGYTYTWAPAMITTACMHGAPAGTYSVSVTDLNGCSATTAVSILQPTAIAASLMASNVTCADSANGIASVSSVSGGTGPYTYLWTTFATTDSITDLGPGSYQIVIRDAHGCALLDSVRITQPAALVVNISVTAETYPGANDGAASVTVAGGTAPYMYQWGNGAVTASQVSLSSGSYPLTVIDAHACGISDTAVITTCATCVWPGDADNSLLVDNNDLLPIGLGYDSTGPARAVTSIVWQGNQAADWTQSFSSYAPAVNYKYADCNGDGAINAADTTAILQNFGLAHSKTITQKPWRSGDPVLYPLLSKDTVTNGDTLTVDIHLGDVSLAATNVYGLAYTINYDPAVVDTTKTTVVYGSSWLGSTTDMISITKDVRAQGMIKTALTRIDHTTRSGSGVIARMRAIVTTDNIDGKDLSYYPVQIIISDVHVIDQHGNVLQVNEGADSGQVAYTALGLQDIGAGTDITVYPNPVNGLLRITAARTAVQAAEVVNTLGEIAGSYTWSDRQADHTIDMSSLPGGVYYIRLHTRGGVAVRKFTVAH